jgi:predicted naringenin-chalcone synthase
MFVLKRMLEAQPRDAQGIAMAFGPGLTVETFAFRSSP